MANFARNAARVWPSLGPTVKHVVEPTKSLNELRQEIWRLRAAFWYRKATTYGEVLRGVRPELRELLHKLRQPGELTYRQVAGGVLAGVQIFGAFCVGEMIGRKNVVGYDVGPVDEYHH